MNRRRHLAFAVALIAVFAVLLVLWALFLGSNMGYEPDPYR